MFRHTVREIEVEGNIIGSDEGVRSDTSIEKLNKLNALFSKDGVVTAGNASQITDGGAVCIVTSRQFATDNGLKIIAAITGQAVSGCAPMDVMYAPVPTVNLKNAGGKRGFATACLGGGLATAIEIEIE